MHASPISRANDIPDAIEVLDDKLDALETPLANELGGSAVDAQLVYLSYYRYKEVWKSVTQIRGPILPLGDI